MRIRFMIAIIILNIFATMTFSILEEYATMGDTFAKLNQTVNLALDTAVDSATASEEFFSNEYNEYISSKALKVGSADEYAQATIRIFSGDKWIGCNTYLLTMFVAEKNRYPASQIEYDSYAENKDVEDVYRYLFGTTGSDYYNSSLEWANGSKAHTDNESRRQPNADFQAFYTGVGYKMESEQYVKIRNGSDNWFMYTRNVPTLCNMGLKLDDCNGVTNYYTADNFTSVDHKGKSYGGESSVYYLTPYSLGVTYIPEDVLKVVFESNLDRLVRLNKCKITPTNESALLHTYASADGCVKTDVYEDSVNANEHIVSSGRKIINDGQVEYDMNSLQVKVDYFVVDMYDKANYKIVNELEGSTPYRVDFETLPERLKDTATGLGGGERIVAKVDAKIQVFLPYTSPIMQWYKALLGGTENHMGISGWQPLANGGDGAINSADEGLWYSTTTYFAITN